MPHDTNGLPCKCGCGENLPSGSPRQFKRGHRADYERRVAAEMAKGNVNAREDAIAAPPAPEVFAGLSDTWDGIKDPFQEAAANLPDDPGPDESARDDRSGTVKPLEGQIVVTKQVAEDIQGKLAFLMSMPTAMLMPLDPVCFPIMQDNIPRITAALVPLICQSPDMVKFFTKSGGFIMWLNLGVALWPVIQVIIAHHLTKSISLDENGKVSQNTRDFTQYAA
jgi:hypothetical protein